MNIIEEIRKKLIKEIKQSGITQKTIAQAIGIKQPTLTQYIKGKCMPALDTFAKICKFLDLDANDMLCINIINIE